MKNGIKTNNIPSALSYIFMGLTVVFNTVSFFFLPDMLITRIAFDGSQPTYTHKALYLVLAAAVICLSGVMTVYFKEKNKKYLVVTSFLFAANVFAVIYNLCV